MFPEGGKRLKRQAEIDLTEISHHAILTPVVAALFSHRDVVLRFSESFSLIAPSYLTESPDQDKGDVDDAAN